MNLFLAPLMQDQVLVGLCNFFEKYCRLVVNYLFDLMSLNLEKDFYQAFYLNLFDLKSGQFSQ